MDLETQFRQMFDLLKNRAKNGDILTEPFYVMSKEVYEIFISPDTDEKTKLEILSMTYGGEKRVNGFPD